ncbi:MAG TPA: 30S ribosomal protein S11 [Candidatus Saccharimonadales bacterium]|nr:30S ribosomal protein S11 [Candidatus Saccharimonadales bacterium]
MAETTTTPEAQAVAPATEAPLAAPAAAKKKKSKRAVAAGQVHVYASFNNTIITVTDAKGGVLVASSAGACGFRGSKKGTAYAAQVAAEKAITGAKQAHGLSKVDVFIKGIGLGRDTAVRVLQSQGIQVESIHDITGVAHGGVRPRKARRV